MSENIVEKRALEKGFEAVIGLEVHAQLLTDSKIFATSSTEFNKDPNSLTDPVTLGLPGSLPVFNKRVVDYAVKLGLATNCNIQRKSIFARKHYFYPDLPKGYQISQFEHPLCLAGNLEFDTSKGVKKVGITRIHLEEDAGKNTHSSDGSSYVDLNRAGTPLVEIVSEPDIRTSEEAGAYLRLLRQIVRYLDVCDGNMEEGSLRCDANVSVRKVGEEKFGTKVEIKNLNSFRFVEKAIDHEIERQIELVLSGEEIQQETRLFDEQSNSTRPMRSKEYAQDYRYYPDPDLPPLVVEDAWVEQIRGGLPELPQEVFTRFSKMYSLDPAQTALLTEERIVAEYFDRAVSAYDNPSALANWVTTELFGRLNKESISFSDSPVSPENLADLVSLIDREVISGKIAKSVFEEMFSTGASPDSIVESKGLKQISDPKVIEEIAKRVVEGNPKQVEAYRGGKDKMFGFFVGQIMKETEGKANPKLVNDILKKLLS